MTQMTQIMPLPRPMHIGPAAVCLRHWMAADAASMVEVLPSFLQGGAGVVYSVSGQEGNHGSTRIYTDRASPKRFAQARNAVAAGS